MPKGYHYEPGSWWSICDVCGFKYKNYELLKRWDGLMVCPKDYETRHPQEFIRAHNYRGDGGLPWTRVEPAIIEAPTAAEQSLCTISGSSAYAGYAIAGCMIAGRAPVLS